MRTPTARHPMFQGRPILIGSIVTTNSHYGSFKGPQIVYKIEWHQLPSDKTGLPYLTLDGADVPSRQTHWGSMPVDPDDILSMEYPEDRA